ncbi:gliding motility-associated C-terminal domain-containing protein [Mucilaginibacter sp. BJC16-A38]|uniref:gliding motility-associated C-terminal domain-containing protein n=1 Tax=Mucilaginibacter phenanthrenivorans TaxID=1234842 RepID=UPI002157B151|nr:gliding motility-associated C-terminal domain-containing protein [Mucilaginibacter phenanthrenivorans]MCR8558554.1 gliding motility-associated C-terminal domain-containing protein [Mucilaginibacter phenanthrenivorans]
MRFLTFLLAFITFCFYTQAGLKPVKSPYPPKKSPIIRFAPGQILTFKIPQQIATEVIDETSHSIGIVVHAGQVITSLTPTITVTAGSTVNPASGVPQNFTSAVGYTVDAADPSGGTYYSVNVLAARSPSPICTGTSTTIAGDPPPPIAVTYRWEILDAAGNWNPAAGINTNLNYTTATLTSNPTTAKIYSFRRAIIVSAVGTTYDSYNDLAVNPSIPIANYGITQPNPGSFCGSGTVGIINGELPTGGNGSYTYQWQISTDNGATFNDIGSNDKLQSYIPPAPFTATTLYRRKTASGPCTPPVVSNTVTISIVEPINSNAITAHGPTSFCVGGQPETITGNGPGGGDGTLIIEWRSSTDNITFTPIIGANDINKYTPPALNVTTYYRRYVTSGPCTTPNIGNLITFTVESALGNNTLTPLAAGSHCASYAPGPLQGSQPTGGDGVNYTYVWQSAATAAGPFTVIPNSNVQNYNPQTVTQTTYYQRAITSDACDVPLLSNVISVNIEPPLAKNTINNPPVVSFCQSGSPGPIPGLLPTGGNGIFTYVWQSSTNGGLTFNPIPNSNVQNYDPQTVTQTTIFQRSVTSGSCTVPLVSGPVTITVTPAITSNIINQPPNASYCVTSSPLTISVQPPTGGNGSYTYQWESSTNNTTFFPINGATSPDYSAPALTKTTWFKRVVSSGFCLGTSESNVVVVTINPALANNIITAPPVNKFCEAGDAGPITGLPPSGGDGNYTYRWEQSTDNIIFTPINGETGATFDPPNLTSTMFYHRVVMNSICTTPLISNSVEIHITPAITGNTINTPPIGFCVSANPGDISGSPPGGGDGPGTYTYQWYSSTDNQATWSLIAGVNTIDYNNPPTIYTTTWYRRDVTSGTCVLQSTPQRIVVNQTPANVSVDPVAPICPGNPAIISVTSPDPTLTYNWYDSPDKSNLLITATSYTTDALTQSKTYHYYVEATNSGSCSSPVLTRVDVTVLTPPSAPVLVNANPSACAGSTTTLSVANPQASLTYNWYPSNANPDQPAIWSLPDFTPPPVGNTTTYYVQAVNSADCMSPYTAATITAKQAPKLVTAKGTSVCPGYQASLTATTFDQNVTINWYADPTGGTSLSATANFQTPPVNTPTTYYVDATDNATGCPSPSRTAVQVDLLQQLATPVPYVSSVTTSTITFQWPAVPGAGEYEVSTDGGATFTFPTGGVSGLTHEVSGLQVNESITIIVRATGAPCQLSANSLPVTGTTIDPLADLIFVANAFTPNGDGKNDVVYVRNRNIKSLKFYVYDQWGEMLYTTVNQQNGWDGTYKGRAEPAGVYVYYLEAIMNDGKQVKKKGTVTLIR